MNNQRKEFNMKAFNGVGLPPIDDLVSVDIGQGYEDTCGIRSQQLILRDFGQNILQEELMREAIAKGWYRVDGTEGTPMFAVGNLLESHGIAVSRYTGATVDDLMNALALGKKVIVAVDADELWGRTPLDDNPDDQTPNHALIVAGVDTSDPENAKVILTDPGTGHVAQSYPLEHFRATWNDSGNMMVVTNNPAPNLPNFDYDEGHILSHIEGVSYAEWHNCHADDFTTPSVISGASTPGGPIDTWLYDDDGDGTPDRIVQGTEWRDFPNFGVNISGSSVTEAKDMHDAHDYSNGGSTGIGGIDVPTEIEDDITDEPNEPSEDLGAPFAIESEYPVMSDDDVFTAEVESASFDVDVGTDAT